MTDEKKEKILAERAAAEAKRKQEAVKRDENIVFIRNPKNGFIMHCNPAVAETYLRKNKGFRRVKNVPDIAIGGSDD